MDYNQFTLLPFEHTEKIIDQFYLLYGSHIDKSIIKRALVDSNDYFELKSVHFDPEKSTDIYCFRYPMDAIDFQNLLIKFLLHDQLWTKSVK